MGYIYVYPSVSRALDIAAKSIPELRAAFEMQIKAMKKERAPAGKSLRRAEAGGSEIDLVEMLLAKEILKRIDEAEQREKLSSAAAEALREDGLLCPFHLAANKRSCIAAICTLQGPVPTLPAPAGKDPSQCDASVWLFLAGDVYRAKFLPQK